MQNPISLYDKLKRQGRIDAEGSQEKAQRIVFEYIMPRLEKTDPWLDKFDLSGVYVVWFSKTLQNWKALVSTTLPDGMYYEVTYNGDNTEVYLDVYKKFDNVSIPDESMITPVASSTKDLRNLNPAGPDRFA
jgi:hypothetical protein